jgi:hypothetical protein
MPIKPKLFKGTLALAGSAANSSGTGRFCIELLNKKCQEVPMKRAPPPFQFHQKCLAIGRFV